MSAWIMNARMYAVTPEVEAAWRTLLEHITREADVTHINTAPRSGRDHSASSGCGAGKGR